jgi:hypothetical protein
MATVAGEILASAVKRSQESAMRFVRFDTEAWAALEQIPVNRSHSRHVRRSWRIRSV